MVQFDITRTAAQLQRRAAVMAGTVMARRLDGHEDKEGFHEDLNELVQELWHLAVSHAGLVARASQRLHRVLGEHPEFDLRLYEFVASLPALRDVGRRPGQAVRDPETIEALEEFVERLDALIEVEHRLFSSCAAVIFPAEYP